MFLPWVLQAQDTFYLRTNYYGVTGSTLREIRQSLDRSRPHVGSTQHDGMTVWSIDWNLSVFRRGNTCRLRSFAIRTKAAITLPFWAMPTNAPADLTKAWGDYSAALGEHELGHVKFAKAAATEIRHRVRTIGPRTDCEALTKEINELAGGILQDYRQKEKEYDERTRHGAAQGAILRAGSRNGAKTSTMDGGKEGSVNAR